MDNDKRIWQPGRHLLPAVILSLCAITSCVQKGADANVGEEAQTADPLYALQDSALARAPECSDTISIRYARGLKVDYMPDGIHVTISNPDPKAAHAPSQEIVIRQASHRFICTTALQLGNFEVLGLEDEIVGINTLRNLFSPRMRQQIEDGSTVMIGREGNFDLETVIACQPDYIFVSASKHGGFEALKDSGIPLIPHHGYKETDPLGQAEWIKLVGLLTGETRRANAVFEEIERQYLALASKVRKAIDGKDPSGRPTVISGRQMRDGWYVAGGRSYMARLFADAGADYVMKDNEESGGVTLDFETVYSKGIHADFWQIDGSYDGEFTLAALAEEDERYATMKAFKKGRVIFCNLAHTPYRELAGVQPQLLLADFVKAFHPQLLPDYTPQYYMPLRK